MPLGSLSCLCLELGARLKLELFLQSTGFTVMSPLTGTPQETREDGESGCSCFSISSLVPSCLAPKESLTGAELAVFALAFVH